MSDSKYKHKGPDNTAPYPVSRMAPSVSLVDMAKEIEQAEQMVNTRVSAKLQVIADQIRNLQAEARQVLEETQRDQQLHRAQCNFQRQPGKIYHLYQKHGDKLYFSMLGPEEWGGEPPHAFQGSYRLEADMSWTPIDEIDAQDDTRSIIRKLLE